MLLVVFMFDCVIMDWGGVFTLDVCLRLILQTKVEMLL